MRWFLRIPLFVLIVGGILAANSALNPDARSPNAAPAMAPWEAR